MGSGTSLHADQTGRHVYRMRDELLPREALLDNNMAFLAQADEMKDCLADVDAANVCRHEMTLLCPPIALHKILLEGDGPSH